MRGYRPNTYGDGLAEVYDDWFPGASEVDAAVDTLAELAAGRAVLELGVGTGRLALPLAGRGLRVHGVDASPAMVDRLRAKPGASALALTVGDMADLSITDPAPYGLVFVACNTFFNLTSAASQQRCLEGVAAVLAPGGRFVVEAFVPAPEDPDSAVEGPDGAVEGRTVEAERVVLSVSRRDRVDQTVAGSYVELTSTGVRLRPWAIRYATPEQLDTMAASVGLMRADRWGGWRRERFDGDSTVHVSVYELAAHGP